MFYNNNYYFIINIIIISSIILLLLFKRLLKPISPTSIEKTEYEFEKMLAFYFKSAVVVEFCFDLNICCLLVLAVKLKNKIMIELNF